MKNDLFFPDSDTFIRRLLQAAVGIHILAIRGFQFLIAKCQAYAKRDFWAMPVFGEIMTNASNVNNFFIK